MLCVMNNALVLVQEQTGKNGSVPYMCMPPRYLVEPLACVCNLVFRTSRGLTNTAVVPPAGCPRQKLQLLAATKSRPFSPDRKWAYLQHRRREHPPPLGYPDTSPAKLLTGDQLHAESMQ